MTSVLRQAGSQTLNTLSNKGVAQIESKICGEVWKKQIRIKTFFEDYDKLRKGFCIEDKFISGLNTALHFLSINLTEEQLRNLVDKYRISPGDLILYSDFVNNIDAQFFNTNLAKSNLQNLKGTYSPEQSDKELVQKLLSYIRWMVTSKRILIKAPLQDYDRTKCSFITKEQFIRVLDNLRLVQNEKLADLLCQKYARSTNPKQIAYVEFIRDVEDINQNQATVVKGILFNSEFKQQKRIVKDPNTVSLTQEFYIDKKLPTRLLPITQVIRKVQAIVTLKRIRIRQFFIDFDGLRKNIVTGEQFKRILNSMGIPLTQSQYKQILKLYRVDLQGSRDQRIKWMNFCDDVDSVFTIKQLEKDPLQTVSQIDSSVFEPVKKIAVQFTEEQESILSQLLSNYESIIKTKRLHLKPQFQDFDITQIGYVTKNQFVRILKQFNLTPPTERQFNLLLKKYMDRGNLNEVNYYQFIRDVDKYSVDAQKNSKKYADTFHGFQAKDRISKASIKTQIPNDLNDLLSRIRRKVKEERIRIAQFMKDFDKLRHWNITKDQFRLSLGMAKFPLSEAEFSLILNNFECENKPNYIRWKDFCDTIDQVFNLKELEKHSPQKEIKLAETNFDYGRQPITEQQLKIADQIKDSFKQYLLANRLDVKQLFQNWDKLSRFKVSPKQFRQVLATVGFNMTDQQTKAICKFYLTDDQKQVKYLEFLKDTKPYDFSYMTEIKEQIKRGTGMRKPIPQKVEDVLIELRKTTKINRLRYKEYFKDFDSLNKGTLKKNKFKGVIYQTMKIPLQEKVFNILENHYEDQKDTTMINYLKFLEDIDIVFNLPDSEKNPIVKPPTFEYTITHSKKEEENIDSLMRRLGQVTRKHRLLLKPFFQDKDIPKIGRVSFTRMRSILDNTKIPLSDYQYNLLCQNFAYDGTEFNYVDFVQALKKYEQS